MAKPYNRTEYSEYTPPPQSTYFDKPSSVTPRPYAQSPQPPVTATTTPYNPYARTEDVQPFTDYSTTYPPAPSARTSQYYPENSTTKLPEPFAYPEQGPNAPSPPPPKSRSLFSRMFDGDQRFAYFCWIVSVVQIGVLIGELVRNAIATGSPIEIQPTFNPLIGPSTYVPFPQSRAQVDL